MLPYIGYSGYSFVNMICIQFVLIAVTWVGGLRDLKRTVSHEEEFSKVIDPVERDGRLASEPEQQRLQERLYLMKGAFVQHASRASYLGLMVGLLCLVEWKYCRGTLSRDAGYVAVGSYVLIGSGTALVVASYLHYERAFQRAIGVMQPKKYEKGGDLYALRPLRVLWSLKSVSLPAFALSAIGAGPWAWDHAKTLLGQ